MVQFFLPHSVVVTLEYDFKTRNAFCGTWYLPHSHVHNERTVPIIMAGCIAYARNGRISTSGEKSDVTIVFLGPVSRNAGLCVYDYVRSRS